jgi:hypothetical protein
VNGFDRSAQGQQSPANRFNDRNPNQGVPAANSAAPSGATQLRPAATSHSVAAGQENAAAR